MDCFGIDIHFANRKKTAAKKQETKQKKRRDDQEQKLVTSCDHLQVLQGRIMAIQARHERAVRSGNTPLAHSLKLQLMTYHGVYEAYQAYAMLATYVATYVACWLRMWRWSRCQRNRENKCFG